MPKVTKPVTTSELILEARSRVWNVLSPGFIPGREAVGHKVTEPVF